MYFSRIRLRTDADTGALAHQLCRNDSYREHQLLWQLFGDDPDAKRDFIFRREDHNGWPQFYLVSQRMPKDRDNVWRIDRREYQPKLRQGQRLAFILRANPVITKKNPAGKRKRHDLVMDLKKQCGWQQTSGNDRSSLYELSQQAGEIWLSSRLERHGAKLDTLNTESYIQHQTPKKGLSKPIRYSTLDLAGTLTVNDPETFTPILYRGMGPAKAFGCGLLLIRRL